MEHPEVLQELLRIEEAIVKLTSTIAPVNSTYSFEQLTRQLNFNQNDNDHVRKLDWFKYVGWAAAIIVGAALFWTINQNTELQNAIETVETDKEFLEEQIEIANSNLEEAEQLITVLRDRNIISVPLAGQEVAPEAFAKVYWDKTNNTIYLDGQGLPEPPRGKVYQVWSLTLDPLTPTSLGIISDLIDDANKIFNINNPNASEAFGITLEPAGGSETPTMEQLFTLGAVGNTP